MKNFLNSKKHRYLFLFNLFSFITNSMEMEKNNEEKKKFSSYLYHFCQIDKVLLNILERLYGIDMDVVTDEILSHPSFRNSQALKLPNMLFLMRFCISMVIQNKLKDNMSTLSAFLPEGFNPDNWTPKISAWDSILSSQTLTVNDLKNKVVSLLLKYLQQRETSVTIARQQKDIEIFKKEKCVIIYKDSCHGTGNTYYIPLLPHYFYPNSLKNLPEIIKNIKVNFLNKLKSSTKSEDIKIVIDTKPSTNIYVSKQDEDSKNIIIDNFIHMIFDDNIITELQKKYSNVNIEITGDPFMYEYSKLENIYNFLQKNQWTIKFPINTQITTNLVDIISFPEQWATTYKTKYLDLLNYSNPKTSRRKQVQRKNTATLNTDDGFFEISPEERLKTFSKREKIFINYTERSNIDCNNINILNYITKYYEEGENLILNIHIKKIQNHENLMFWIIDLYNILSETSNVSKLGLNMGLNFPTETKEVFAQILFMNMLICIALRQDIVLDLHNCIFPFDNQELCKIFELTISMNSNVNENINVIFPLKYKTFEKNETIIKDTKFIRDIKDYTLYKSYQKDSYTVDYLCSKDNRLQIGQNYKDLEIKDKINF